MVLRAKGADAITAGDYRNWKESEVSKLLFEYILNLMNSKAGTLVIDAGLNPAQDRWNAGFIKALGEVFDWTPDLREGD